MTEFSVDLFKFPPQEVPGQNSKCGGGNAQRSARCTDSGKRKDVANEMWRTAGKDA